MMSVRAVGACQNSDRLLFALLACFLFGTYADRAGICAIVGFVPQAREATGTSVYLPRTVGDIKGFILENSSIRGKRTHGQNGVDAAAEEFSRCVSSCK